MAIKVVKVTVYIEYEETDPADSMWIGNDLVWSANEHGKLDPAEAIYEDITDPNDGHGPGKWRRKTKWGNNFTNEPNPGWQDKE